jgi:hypothetical protein
MLNSLYIPSSRLGLQVVARVLDKLLGLQPDPPVNIGVLAARVPHEEALDRADLAKQDAVLALELDVLGLYLCLALLELVRLVFPFLAALKRGNAVALEVLCALGVLLAVRGRSFLT